MEKPKERHEIHKKRKAETYRKSEKETERERERPRERPRER